MEKLSYKVGTFSTDVYYGKLNESTDTLKSYKNALWIVDDNTERFLPAFAQRVVKLPQGEHNKTWVSIEKILNTAINLSFGRDDTIIGLGGGVICDMAGFAASVYMRGCKLVLIPSTLLAMNDASLGGKTGIDYQGYKNLLGAFYPASEIYVFTDIVQTLTDRDYLSGLAEIIKHAFLNGNEFIEYLHENKKLILSRDIDCLSNIIPRSLNIKGDIVENDPREQGKRAFLNLGHTFGHALETVSQFDITHGEGVAWGIGKAMDTGVRMQITDPSYADAVKRILAEYGYELSYPSYDPKEILKAMQMDKKKQSGDIRFVLQKGAADTVITTVPEDILIDVLSN